VSDDFADFNLCSARWSC